MTVSVADLVDEGTSLAAWRDRALEAEARLHHVRDVVGQLRSALFVDVDGVDRVAAELDAPGPTIRAGQTWETRWGGITRQAVILGVDDYPTRDHPRGARFWRIRAQRLSTIREDVLRKRWTLVERGLDS